MKSAFSRVTRFAVRAAARLALLAVLVAVGFAFYVLHRGVPDRVLQGLLRRIDSPAYAVSAEWATLDLADGLALHDVQVFRKRVVGPPAVEAAQCTLRINYAALLRREPAVREILLADAVVRPDTAFRRDVVIDEQRPPTMHADMRIEIDRCELDGVELRGVSFRLTAQGHTMNITKLQGAISDAGHDGEISGTLVYDNRRRVLKGNMVGELDPHLLLPLLKQDSLAFTRGLIRRFQFEGTHPRSEFTFEQRLHPRSLRASSRFWLQRCRYRGIELLRADGAVSFYIEDGHATVSVDPLLAVRADGILDGGFTVDSKSRTVAFDGTSTTDVGALARLLGASTNRFLARCTFSEPAVVQAKGVADFGDASETDFLAGVAGRGLKVLSLDVDEYSFRLHALGLTNSLEQIRGEAYGGWFTGDGIFSRDAPGSTALTYRVEGEFGNCDFAALAASSGARRDVAGRMSGRLTLSGPCRDPGLKMLQGKGAIRIRDGHVFMLPVFGGLSEFLSRTIPGLDLLISQTDARADFQIADGKIHADKISIEGGVLSLSAHGDYYFDKRLDFEVQVRLLKEHTLVAKLLRVITYPISKLFEFRLRGRLDDPVWYPVNFSADLLEKLGLVGDKTEEEQ